MFHKPQSDYKKKHTIRDRINRNYAIIKTETADIAHRQAKIAIARLKAENEEAKAQVQRLKNENERDLVVHRTLIRDPVRLKIFDGKLFQRSIGSKSKSSKNYLNSNIMWIFFLY